jgi:hypothetical protein
MSGADTSQGPGWWQASDGKWYPPEQIPASPPTPVPTPPPTPTSVPAAPMVPAATPAAPGGSGQAGGPGFFARLFDVSMKTFITPSIIKVLFVLGLVMISIFTLILVIAGTQADGGTVFILLAPLYWFFGVLYLRVILEVIVVLFRIEENTRGQR